MVRVALENDNDNDNTPFPTVMNIASVRDSEILKAAAALMMKTKTYFNDVNGNNDNVRIMRRGKWLYRRWCATVMPVIRMGMTIFDDFVESVARQWRRPRQR